MIFQQILNEESGCLSYLIGCGEAGKALVVDPGRVKRHGDGMFLPKIAQIGAIEQVQRRLLEAILAQVGTGLSGKHV